MDNIVIRAHNIVSKVGLEWWDVFPNLSKEDLLDEFKNTKVNDICTSIDDDIKFLESTNLQLLVNKGVELKIDDIDKNNMFLKNLLANLVQNKYISTSSFSIEQTTDLKPILSNNRLRLEFYKKLSMYDLFRFDASSFLSEIYVDDKQQKLSFNDSDNTLWPSFQLSQIESKAKFTIDNFFKNYTNNKLKIYKDILSNIKTYFDNKKQKDVTVLFDGLKLLIFYKWCYNKVTTQQSISYNTFLNYFDSSVRTVKIIENINKSDQ